MWAPVPGGSRIFKAQVKRNPLQCKCLSPVCFAFYSAEHSFSTYCFPNAGATVVWTLLKRQPRGNGGDTLRLYPSRTLTSPLSLRPFAQEKTVTCFSALGFCGRRPSDHPGVGRGEHAQFHFSLMTNQLEQLFLPNTAHRALPQMKTLDFSPQCGHLKTESCIIKQDCIIYFFTVIKLMSYHQGVRFPPCIFYLLIILLAFASFTVHIFSFASIVLIAANVPRAEIKSGIDVSTPSGVFVIQKKTLFKVTFSDRGLKFLKKKKKRFSSCCLKR